MNQSGIAKSPLPGVADDAWMAFVSALEVQAPRDVSESGGFGAYDIRPRRLEELGLARVLERTRGKTGRARYECDFIAPLTRDRFLSDPLMQYRALSQSMRRYFEELQTGEVIRPVGATMAGALAILHRGMRGALRQWPNLFTETRARYEAAQGAF